MKRTKRILSAALAGTMLCGSCVGASAAGFSDVNESDWYYEAVTSAVESGFMKGMGDGSFGASKPLTREMVVTVLAALSGSFDYEKYAELAADFTDVDEDAWYAPYIAWAEANGVSAGMGDGTFGVGRSVTRQELATFANSFSRLTGILPLSELTGLLTTYTADWADADEIAGWASEACEVCGTLGIFSGDDQNRFRPEDSATRAEAAAVFGRLVSVMEQGLEFLNTHQEEFKDMIGFITGGDDQNEETTPIDPAQEEQTETPETREPVVLAEDSVEAAADFSVRLFQNCFDGENTLVSPLSVLLALGMLQDGADGDTLKQLQEASGMTSEEWNAWAKAVSDSLPSADKLKVTTANSVWIKDDPLLTVKQTYLALLDEWYGQEALVEPFDDSTAAAINSWVSEQTDGMIDKIVDRIPEEAALYLVNALCFDAKWQSPYTSYDVDTVDFTLEDGTTTEQELMYDKQYSGYLEDDNATGFVRYYDRAYRTVGEEYTPTYSYAFVALLPNEGVSVEDYVSGLTGEHLLSLLKNPQNECVYTGLLKFSQDCGFDLADTLKQLGVTDAFVPELADLSPIGSYADNPLYVSSVLHKTHIEVTEEGTRAAAATAVALAVGSALDEDPKYVYLDRPFVYLLVDLESDTILFMGAEMNPGE